MTIDIETMKPLLDPKSIAIIGASSDLTKIGGRPIKGLIDFKYQGRILPVNPKYKDIAGLRCYPSIQEVPGDIDLAIIVVPGSAVVSAVQACGERGVRSVIVMSAGFAEIGGEGRQAQDEILSAAKKYNMRVLGPNTVGMFNLISGAMGNFGIGTQLGEVPKGRIAIASQSGAFCAYVYTLAAEGQIGLNYFVGTGNQADVDVADCIAYFAEDADTDVIVLYMEGISDINKLTEALELAKRRNKPVIAIKSGSSERGRRAIVAHTASSLEPEEIYEKIFRKTGVYQVESIQELLDVAMACSYGILPRGNRVAVFTISGAAGVILADQLTALGMDLPEPSAQVQKALLEKVPYASVFNPIDMTGQLVNQPELMGQFMNAVLEKGQYDMVLTYISDLGYNETILDKFLTSIREVRAAHPHIPQLMTTNFTRESKKKLHDTEVIVYNDLTRMVKVTKGLFHLGSSLVDYAELK
jgi:acyl-CoA synthetase (NDP forming)